MGGMKNPAKWHGEIIRRVDDTSSVVHYDFARIFPILDSNMLNIDVTRAFNRNVSVDHFDSRHVVFVYTRGNPCSFESEDTSHILQREQPEVWP